MLTVPHNEFENNDKLDCFISGKKILNDPAQPLIKA